MKLNIKDYINNNKKLKKTNIIKMQLIVHQ